MSKYPCFLRSISFLPLAAALVVTSWTVTAPISVLGRELARLDGFSQAGGGHVFALTLKPPAGRPELQAAAHAPRDTVVLVSTAASQTGDYRAKSLATLQAMLSKLEPGDRVELVAFDLHAAALTRGFVAAESPEMALALSALKRRTPLGACDLEKALVTATESFAGDGKSARAIVYIGDGSSRANVLSADQLDRLVRDLVARRATVIAFGVGPQVQEQVLGILASRTGGLVLPEQPHVDAGFYGAALARAVHGSVFWPTPGENVKWPAGMDVYPKVLPPLRSDRDTVLVGTAKSTAATRVAIAVQGPAGAETLTWDIPELKSQAGNSYLATLVDQAKADGGRALPLVDSASLATAKQEIEAGGRGLAYWAREALAAGNLDSADRLATAALSRNPNERTALALKEAIAKAADKAAPAGGKAASSPLAAEAGDLVLQAGSGAAASPNGAAAAQEIQQGGALEEQWQRDVQNAIDKSRTEVAVDPQAAGGILQSKMSDLAAATDLRAEIRDRLLAMLHAASREIAERGELLTHRRQQRMEEEAARREREMTDAALQQDQNKFRQLMDRFDSLMAEGRHRLAEESVALEMVRIVDRSLPSAGPAAVAAMDYSRFLGAYDDMMAVRVARQKGFVAALARAEHADVPLPDDPPIVYQDSEAWKELTARRKERYAAMDRSQQSPAEKKIEEALRQPTQIEFVETPLKDVVEYLKDLHHIEIQLDLPALKEASVDENTPVTKSLKGISLRSALKLLLDELQLKYVVHDEVLLITSPARAESGEFAICKVYPVAELVLPIQQAGFTGGFGGLGGFGGFGGQRGLGGTMMGGNQPGAGNPMGNGNMFGNGNQMGNGNMFGNGNQMGNGNQAGNGLFNVPAEVVPRDQ